jgi:hypothetical protein
MPTLEYRKGRPVQPFNTTTVRLLRATLWTLALVLPVLLTALMWSSTTRTPLLSAQPVPLVSPTSLDVSVTTVATTPPCSYDTPIVAKPVAPRAETHLKLDLSQPGKAAFVSLLVPSDDLAFLASGSIKLAKELKRGDTIKMTGYKIGVVTHVEQQQYIPQQSKVDAQGNIGSRVVGKSERFVDTMLYLHTPDEIIKTTPEHPFFVDGQWVEAQRLQPGMKIRTKSGGTIVVEETETKHDPQMVHSLLVEGTHNFYVGRDGLLAHNCTPTFDNKVIQQVESVLNRYPINSGKCDICSKNVYKIFKDAGYNAEIGRIDTNLPFITTKNNISVSRRLGSSSDYHEFVRVGDRVFDALTGSKGMTMGEYQSLFYDDVFIDGTFRVSFSSP